ncbi:uncharacterized protein LOC116114835 [Pistacia vera]|uniref:uncharacterized protein LOC116114835 n=1 Tax=Pistacia vera TaxID=55513 RepID=UPI001262EC9A|nr:uncharacterized protein LOC116114835 [Pistacia vera]
MAEEFQESDIIFSDYDRRHEDRNTINNSNSYFTEQHGEGVVRNKKKNKKVTSNSVPVNINIPDNIYHFVDTDEFEEEYEDGEITPPHVIVGRRIPGKMAFSVCTGNGRTLKGRDLSRVRNSILRMTGFLEA